MQRRKFLGLALVGGAGAMVPWALRRRRESGIASGIETSPDGDRLGFDRLGNAYRLDARRNQLQRLGASTDPGWSSGGTGSRPGELNAPTALAFDDGHRIYVADTGNGRIQVFEPDGSVSRIIGGSDRELSLPRDLAFGADGLLYVCDTLGHRIQIFDGNGRAVGSIGGFGRGPGELNGPRSLAFAPDGSLHVLDAGNARIQVFGTRGQPIAIYGESAKLHMPGSLAFDDEGRAYVAEASSGTVAVFADGRLKGRFAPRDAEGRALSPSWLTFDPQRRLRITGTPAATPA